jgi:hypothetical protein
VYRCHHAKNDHCRQRKHADDSANNANHTGSTEPALRPGVFSAGNVPFPAVEPTGQVGNLVVDRISCCVYQLLEAIYLFCESILAFGYGCGICDILCACRFFLCLQRRIHRSRRGEFILIGPDVSFSELNLDSVKSFVDQLL